VRSTNVNTQLNNLGTLLANGATNITDTLTTAPGSLLRIQGNGTFSTATLTVARGFENAGTVELTDTTSSYGATLAVTNGKLVNLPGALVSVVAGTNGPRTLTAELDNQGALAVALGVGRTFSVNRPSSVHVNSGTIDVSGGDLTITQSGTTPSFTNVGAMTLGGNDTLTVSGGVFSYGGGTLDGPGTLVLSGVNPAIFSKPHTLGSIIMSSSTASFSSAQSTGSTAFSLTTSTLNGPGTVTNAAGKTLKVSSSTINTPLFNDGTLIAAGASTLGAAITTSPGSVIRAQGNGTFSTSTLSVTAAGGLLNNGAIELTDTTSSYGATLKVTGGPLRNAVGATIDAQVGFNGPRTLDATLDNQGTLTVARPLSIIGASAVHTNKGLIKVSGGDVTVSQSGGNPSFTNQAGGIIDLNTGRTLKVTNGPVRNEQGGTITGTGTLDVRAPATFANAGNLTPGGPGPGILNVAGDVTFETTGALNVDLAGPTVGSQYDRLAVAGTVTSVLTGTLNASVTFTPTSGQTFDVMTCTPTCTNRFAIENVPLGWLASYLTSLVRLTAP
jgi:hypothetical protein